MPRYDEQFKLSVVQDYISGAGGEKLLSRKYEVPEEKVRTWVSRYRIHGINGLRPKRSCYSANFKLEVLYNQQHEQLSCRQVAAFYDIRNPNQAAVWRSKFNASGLPAFEDEYRSCTQVIQDNSHAPTHPWDLERAISTRCPISAKKNTIASNATQSCCLPYP